MCAASVRRARHQRACNDGQALKKKGLQRQVCRAACRVVRHARVQATHANAKNVYLAGLLQYNGSNNGNLSLPLSRLKEWGCTGNRQRSAAIAELVNAGWIIRTRKGGLGIGPDLFAISVKPIDDCFDRDGRRKHHAKTGSGLLHLWRENRADLREPMRRRRIDLRVARSTTSISLYDRPRRWPRRPRARTSMRQGSGLKLRVARSTTSIRLYNAPLPWLRPRVVRRYAHRGHPNERDAHTQCECRTPSTVLSVSAGSVWAAGHRTQCEYSRGTFRRTRCTQCE